MKQIIYFWTAIIIFLVFASGSGVAARNADLSNYPHFFSADGQWDTLLVVGERAPPIDNLALTDVAAGIEDAGYKFPVGSAKLDSEIEKPLFQDLIVVGRRNENTIVDLLLGPAGDLYNLKEGQAVIILFENNNFVQLLVTGYTSADSRRAAKVLKNFKNYENLKGKAVLVTGTLDNPIVAPFPETYAVEQETIPLEPQQDPLPIFEPPQDIQPVLEEKSLVDSGSFTLQDGQQVQIQQQGSQNIQIQSEGVAAQTSLEIISEKTSEGTKLTVSLSNGANADVKVMPDTASKTALEKLKLQFCSEENSCQIELKEVAVGEQRRAAYQIQAEKKAKILGLFPTTMHVQTQIDAENGVVIKTDKPWWNILATE